MKCLDCPELGPFEGRPEPRATCCVRDALVRVSPPTPNAIAAMDRERTGGLNRATRRAARRKS